MQSVSGELRAALPWVLDQLDTSEPRRVGPSSSDRPIVVFLDGACEDAGVTVGGVAMLPVGVQFFGMVVPPAVVQSWKSAESQRQTIGQAELFPAAVARWTWSSHFAGKRVIFFIDNEAARLGLVKSYSPVLASLRLIQDCLEWDRSNECIPWYARVPSFSNPADAPSRMVKGDFLAALGAVAVAPVLAPSFTARYDFELGVFATLH